MCVIRRLVDLQGEHKRNQHNDHQLDVTVEEPVTLVQANQFAWTRNTSRARAR